MNSLPFPLVDFKGILSLPVDLKYIVASVIVRLLCQTGKFLSLSITAPSKVIPEEIIPYGAEYLLEMEAGKIMETAQDELLLSKYSFSLPLFHLHGRSLHPSPIDLSCDLLDLSLPLGFVI